MPIGKQVSSPKLLNRFPSNLFLGCILTFSGEFNFYSYRSNYGRKLVKTTRFEDLKGNRMQLEMLQNCVQRRSSVLGSAETPIFYRRGPMHFLLKLQSGFTQIGSVQKKKK